MEMAQKQQKREKLEQEVSFVWRDVHHLEEELERVEEELAYRLEKEEEKSQETLPQSSEQTNGQTPQETAQSAGSLSSSESITAQHEPSSSDKNQQS